MILHSSEIGVNLKHESCSSVHRSLGVPWRVLDRPKVLVADIRVFIDMSLVATEPNKRENPGLVTKGTSLLLGMQALKYSCQYD